MADDEKVKLERNLGLLNGITMVVGIIIGSGIFITPKGVLINTGLSPAYSLITWAFCGAVSFVGSLCYAELGCMISKSGGDYAYIKEAFGDFAAFLVLWVNIIIIRPTVQAIVSLTFAKYAMYPFFGDCSVSPPNAQIALAAFCIISLTIINAWSVKLATKIQDLFTYAKLLALIAIIITGGVYLFLGRFENFENAFEMQEDFGPGNFALAMYSGLFAYYGWNFLNFITGELKNPSVNLPRAIYISLPLVSIIYVLTNVAYLLILTPTEIKLSEAVAVTMSDRVYGVFTFVMPICVSLSCFGGVNGLLFTSGRLNVVGATDGMLPQLLGMVHYSWLTPIPAMLLTAGISVILLGFDVGALIEYVSIVMWLSIGLSVVALIVLRTTRPDIDRPIKFPMIVPVGFLLICCFLIVFPLITSPRNTGMGMLCVLSGVPVYVLGMGLKGVGAVNNFIDGVTSSVQKTLCVVPQMGEDVNVNGNEEEVKL